MRGTMVNMDKTEYTLKLTTFKVFISGLKSLLSGSRALVSLARDPALIPSTNLVVHNHL